MRIRAFIFARGGSKGVPRKNIRDLAGKPLIAHAIEIARACPSLGTVLVSTDDAEIAEVARAHGAQVPFLRPAELAGDTASEWLAWRHAIEWVAKAEGEFDLFVSLPTTSPFRAVEDVEACIRILRDEPQTDVVATVKAADRSPYFNMVRINEDGAAQLVIPPSGPILRRQDAPAVFDMTTVCYVARTSFIREKAGLFEGRLRVVEVPAERALDIDTPFDFAIAEYLAETRKIGSLPPQ
ncbi:acylneuraminate cytidylyltransferase family protein [Sphingomonas gei]|uniref:Acylneuraminate cytidylyltransferase family protein n=1 Tax=Sphingomonas gei TaxID=1395960 RepID=A0A4S1X5X2_9SPHN|nr:acylneuraminate cytidylyltransferase family protein [Sphingomonas gei]TGX50380.1 acylneuraminate cytidylyltransferase family protein [Sphingomonas gei]